MGSHRPPIWALSQPSYVFLLALKLPASYSPHPPEGKCLKDQSTLQKLLHINATALLEHPDYRGPLLPASALASRPSAPDKKMTPLQKELQETLKVLLGSSDRGCLEVATRYGWVLGKGSLS